MIFSSQKLTALSVSPIVLANLAFPSRNVLIKLDQRNDPAIAARSTELRFFSLHSAALPFALLVAVPKLLWFGVQFGAMRSMLRNAVLFNSYQFASIAILEQLDALTHSLANTMKRFTGILLSFVVLGEIVTVRHLLGLVCTMIGFPMYVFGSRKFATAATAHGLRPKSNRAPYVALTVLIFLVVAMFGRRSIPDVGDVVDNLVKGNISPSSFSARDRVPPKSAKQYLVYVPDHYMVYSKKKAVSRVFKNYEEALEPHGNMGNKVWHHGAFLKLPDFSETPTCNHSRSVCLDQLKRSVNGEQSQLIEYRPGANYFNSQRTADFGYDLRVLSKNSHLLLIGVGSQASFTKNESNDDINPGMKIQVRPKDFEFSTGGKNLLTALQERKQVMLFRGDFTLEAARTIGYTYGISNGCPSLFISTDVHLGQSLQKKYDALKTRIGDKSLRVAINMKNSERFTEYYKNVLRLYPNSYIYAQGRTDLVNLQSQGVPFNRVRFFDNVEEWRKSLRGMDVSIGARIHGNMAAISVGLPVYVIAPDHRVLELVRRMRVPHITWYDEGMSTEPGDIAERISGAGFNGKAFDDNRCEIAMTYIRVFREYGIGVSPHVRKISQIC